MADAAFVMGSARLTESTPSFPARAVPLMKPGAAAAAEVVEQLDAEELTGRAADEVVLQAVLAEEPTGGDYQAVEDRLRRLCHLAEQLGIVQPRRGTKDWLHTVLADRRNNHVSDRKRAELNALTESVRHQVSDLFTEYLHQQRERARLDQEASGAT